jgi:hypothetical protein
MKKLLLLLVLSISVIQLANAQVIELVGKGVLNEDNPTLIIPNMENVEKVVVEAVGHFVNAKDKIQKIPQTVTFSSGVPIVTAFKKVDKIHSSVGKFTDPFYYLHNWVLSLGYYTATFNKNQIAGGAITLDKNGQGESIISFYAYVFRTDGTVNKYSFLSEKRAYLYRSGEEDPLEYEFDIPASQSERNIKVTIPFSDNFESGVDLRVAVISLLQDNDLIFTESFNINGLETNFIAKTIDLENIPGNITKIKIKIYSPLEPGPTGGDSFIAGMITLNVENYIDCAICKGGITSLELQYTGSVSAQKISVYKGKVDKKNLLAEFTDVKPDEIIKFTGNEKNNTMGANIIIAISGNVKYTEIHTSCSKDIYAGMQFGDFLIVSGTSKDGGPLCLYEEPPCADCKGGITSLELQYTGSVSVQKISVYKGKTDKKNLLAEFTDVKPHEIIKFTGNEKNNTMGTNIIIAISGNKKHTEIHTSCSKDIYAGMQFGDFLIVSGTSKDGGPLCEKPGDNGNCGECKGGVTELLLEYNATGTGMDLIVKNKNGVIPSTYNAISKTILISNKGDKLGTEIYITVDGKTTALHTSCSKPIYIGMSFGLGGVFKILDGTSKDGGKLCDKPYDNKKKSASIESIAEIHDFGVYPNPVIHIATVSFTPTYDGIATVDLYNSLGQRTSRLMHQSVAKDIPVSFTFNAKQFNEGLYILMIQNGPGRESVKIQISK